jgi:hypothetical protein
LRVNPGAPDSGGTGLLSTAILGILPRKIPLRSLSEIRFRLRQELSNVRFAAFPPRLPAATVAGTPGPFAVLPDPAEVASGLKPSAFAAECLQVADDILKHRFPLLGLTIETGDEIRWRRDYVSGRETEAAYFRRIPYLDVSRAGDHKTIWEINRHQHLVLLAQACLFSGERRYLDEIVRELDSWRAQNPFQRGINWASALEVGFRALSWIWIYHLVGDRFDDTFRRRFLEGLYHHGLHLEVNLSYYFSPNTHLLGEAVALHALGCLFPQFPRAKRWQETGARVVQNELDRQVLADGCHFELSTYYHVYALDMFLFHAVLRGLDDRFRHKLTRMAEFLDAVTGTPGTLPFIGDDDGGRLFHPYGSRHGFPSATLATCGEFLGRAEWIREGRDREEQAAWWLKARPAAIAVGEGRESRRFAESGLVVMTATGVQLIADTGPFGPGNAGHSHADTLSVILRRDGEEILVDPGTYTYVGDPQWRERFRGTAAHNTICVDGLGQATAKSPFAWASRPDVEVLGWESSSLADILIAVCSYAGFRHRRKIVFHKGELWIAVLDRVEGPAGEHRIEQFWHCGETIRQRSPHCFQVGVQTLIRLAEGGEVRLLEGWVSPALGAKEPAPVLCVERQGELPASLGTIIDVSGKERVLRLREDAENCGPECVEEGYV